MPMPMPSHPVAPSDLNKMANEPGVLVEFLKFQSPKTPRSGGQTPCLQENQCKTIKLEEEGEDMEDDEEEETKVGRGTLCPQTQFLDAEEASAAAGACLVVMDRINPWFICYQCFKILTDFYMFKQQCYENNLLLERQTEKKQEDRNISLAKITVKKEEIDVEESEVIEIPASKEEVDHNIEIQEGTSLEDHLADAEVNMPSEEEVEIKDDCDADIPQMKVRLGGEVLQEQDKHQKQDDAGEDASSTQLHVCEKCSKESAGETFISEEISEDLQGELEEEEERRNGKLLENSMVVVGIISVTPFRINAGWIPNSAAAPSD
ncbi:gelsolin-related protein of 125 kDa-like [Hetaerina americana]|uniref:gelsolin-related protein of 125 kDa-like n=1 Tax=Hetaerina americana TaxID=62018 RepID=UPI003A7F5C2E